MFGKNNVIPKKHIKRINYYKIKTVALEKYISKRVINKVTNKSYIPVGKITKKTV